MTWAASPPAIFGWACRIPSNIHSTPNPMRSRRRPRASAAALAAWPAALAAPPFAVAGATRQVRAVAQMSQRKTIAMRAIAPWCSSADLKAATSVGSAGFRPEFMPGKDPAPLYLPRWLPASIGSVSGRDGSACGQT